MTKEPVPVEIEDMFKIWRQHSGILRGLHVALGVTAIVTSVTVASRLVDVSSNLISFIAWSAAISSPLLSSMNLETKSNHYRTAWRMLNAAVLRYEIEDDFKIKDLNDAYEKGENIIGDVKINLPAYFFIFVFLYLKSHLPIGYLRRDQKRYFRAKLIIHHSSVQCTRHVDISYYKLDPMS